MNLRVLLTGDINRLRYVDRYSTSMVMHRENVAEHTFYTVLYTDVICRWLDRHRGNMPMVYSATCIRKALYHDIEECKTGDIQRPFKHITPEFKDMVENISIHLVDNLLEDIFDPDEDTLIDNTYSYWKDAKDDSVEGLIVSFADFLSVLSYLYAQAGTINQFMLYHYDTIQEYSEGFKNPKYDFIRPLVDDALAMVDEMNKGL